MRKWTILAKYNSPDANKGEGEAQWHQLEVTEPEEYITFPNGDTAHAYALFLQNSTGDAQNFVEVFWGEGYNEGGCVYTFEAYEADWWPDKPKKTKSDIILSDIEMKMRIEFSKCINSEMQKFRHTVITGQGIGENVKGCYVFIESVAKACSQFRKDLVPYFERKAVKHLEEAIKVLDPTNVE